MKHDYRFVHTCTREIFLLAGLKPHLEYITNSLVAPEAPSPVGPALPRFLASFLSEFSDGQLICPHGPAHITDGTGVQDKRLNAS